MATTGVSVSVEGMDSLLKKVANMKDLKKQQQFIFRLLGTSATPVLKAYKNSLPKMYPTRMKNQTFNKNGYVYKGDLIKSIEKIRSKGRHPAIYIGPRSKRMRKGKKGNLDGFFIQFLKYGNGKKYYGDPTLLSEVGPATKAAGVKIGKGLRERIQMEWDK